MKRKDFTYQAIILALLIHVVILGAMHFVPLSEVPQETTYVAVDMAVFEEMPEERTLEEIIAERIQQDVANLISDANSEQSADRRSFVSQRQQERINQQVEQELRALEQETFDGLAEERAENQTDDPQEATDTDIPDQPLDSYDYYGKSYNGNVTAEVDVPGREVRYLHIPGYKCKGGGKVVVTINVDQKGKVTEAEIDAARSSYTGDCIPSEAVNAALKSIFFVQSSAPKRSPGTITFRFIPQ